MGLFLLGLQRNQSRALIEARARGHEHLFHYPITPGGDGRLQFHAFDDHKRLTVVHLLASLDLDGDDHAGHGRHRGVGARAARSGGFASETDQVVVTAGVPFNVPGTTNILRIAPCDERLIYNTDPE